MAKTSGSKITSKSGGTSTPPMKCQPSSSQSNNAGADPNGIHKATNAPC